MRQHNSSDHKLHQTTQRNQSTLRSHPAHQKPLRFEGADAVLSGRAYVVDGDSLRIRNTEVRLFGIDAPELNHPYGVKAKLTLLSLCKGQTVSAEFINKDDYGRNVARCRLEDGRDLSAEMVKMGLAIDWPKFSGGEYRSLEIPGARKKMWLADARQKGRMHVWDAFEATQRR